MCSAMSVDPDGGHIAVGGTGADMKNYIRIYDLQVNRLMLLIGSFSKAPLSPTLTLFW